MPLYFDTQSPRPYDLAFRVQGTNGIYMMEKDAIYIQGEGKADTWQSIDEYREKINEHPLWQKFAGVAEQLAMVGGLHHPEPVYTGGP